MSTKTIHFDLHFAGADLQQHNLKLSIRGIKHEVLVHTPSTIKNAVQENESLAIMIDRNANAMTHYAEIPADMLPDDRLSMFIVEAPKDEENPDVRPEVYFLSYYIPDLHIEEYFRKQVKELEKTCEAGSEKHTKGLQSLLHPKFLFYGVQPDDCIVEDAEQLVSLNVGNNNHMSTIDIAIGLLFRHPQMSTNNVKAAVRIKLSHILQVSNPNRAQIARVKQLKDQIDSLGADWAKTVESKDLKGNLAIAEYDLKGKDDKYIFKKGQQFYQFEISDDLDTFISGPLGHSIKSVRRDPKLQNEHWSVNQGTGAITKEGKGNNGSVSADSAQASAGGFTLVDKSPGYGLSLFSNSIVYKKGNNSENKFGSFSIRVDNTFLRQLGVYVEFYKDEQMTQVIDDPKAGTQDWNSYLSAALAKDFETPSKKMVGTVPNVQTMMGIPIGGGDTTLEFNWPEEAQSARLYFAGIGNASNTIRPIIWPGVILTSVFQFALPTFFLVAGTALTFTGFYKNIIGNKVFKIILFNIAVPVINAIVNLGISGNAGRILASFGQVFLTLLGKAEFLPISMAIAAQIVAGEAEDNIPVVGIGFRIANIALTAIGLAETGIESGISPAVIETRLKRQMSLEFTLHPDPKHGEPGDPHHGEPGDTSSAIWPLVGDHVETIVTYTNGTSYKHTLDLPKTSSNAPLVFTFEDMGWGGQLQIEANVYSKNGWLCGQYKGSTIDAVPDNQNVPPYIMTQKGDIKEFLVPLTQDTQYQYHQKLSYNDTSKQHEWEVGSIPVSTITNLGSGGTGNQLSETVDITINDKAFQIGYAYRANNQGIPIEGSSVPTSDQMFVFQNISALADSTLNKRLKQSKIGFKQQPYILYDKFGQGPRKDDISPYNFVVDSRDGKYFVRQIDLTDGTHDFGLTGSDLKSYGQFTIPHLDAIVFHNSGYVIGVSFKDSAVQTLKLNLEKGPVVDKDAPVASTLSGPGLMQGLTLGPISMKTTPDGRIIILESLNRRIQAFDVKGNPVPSFPGRTRLKIPVGEFANELDKKTFSKSLQQQFDQNGLTKVFSIADSSSYIKSLDDQVLTQALINAFAEEDIFLTYEKKQDGSIIQTGGTYITKQTAGSLWTVTDPLKDFVYTLEKVSGGLQIFDVLNNVNVNVVGAGKKWIVNDLAGARSFLIELEADTKNIEVKDYRSYFWLGKQSRTSPAPAWLNDLLDNKNTEPIGEFIYYNLDPTIDCTEAMEIVANALANPLDPSDLPYLSNVTYLDIAVESKGYIYILYYKNDGSKNTDYYLDIYDPSGNFVVTSPDSKLYSDPSKMQHVSAARMTLDLFRNLFTLNFEAYAGATTGSGLPGRTEASISTWTPTPPMVSLPTTDLAVFQSLDISKIKAITVKDVGTLNDVLKLSGNAKIENVEPKDSTGQYSHFIITDGEKQYDIIVSLTSGNSPGNGGDTVSQKIFIYNILA